MSEKKSNEIDFMEVYDEASEAYRCIKKALRVYCDLNEDYFSICPTPSLNDFVRVVGSLSTISTSPDRDLKMLDFISRYHDINVSLDIVEDYMQKAIEVLDKVLDNPYGEPENDQTDTAPETPLEHVHAALEGLEGLKGVDASITTSLKYAAGLLDGSYQKTADVKPGGKKTAA
jgi:hypothetical protein